MRTAFERKVQGTTMILAPSLFALSTFFWDDGEYSVTSGALLVVSMAFWIPSFAGLFELVKNRFPKYAAIAFLLAVYGCVGGSNFGLEGMFTTAFQISHQETLEKFAAFPMEFNLVLFWPGPLFPLSILVLGIVVARIKAAPLSICLLLLVGAISFPISRIPPRLEILAHISDAFLLIPMAFLGWRSFLGNKE